MAVGRDEKDTFLVLIHLTRFASHVTDLAKWSASAVDDIETTASNKRHLLSPQRALRVSVQNRNVSRPSSWALKVQISVVVVL